MALDHRSFDWGFEAGALIVASVIPLLKRMLVRSLYLVARTVGQELVSDYIKQHFLKRPQT